TRAGIGAGQESVGAETGSIHRIQGGDRDGDGDDAEDDVQLGHDGNCVGSVG
ncbi:hypothetical protein BBO99_00005299, partial [Phytophthora kernoviae]